MIGENEHFFVLTAGEIFQLFEDKVGRKMTEADYEIVKRAFEMNTGQVWDIVESCFCAAFCDTIKGCRRCATSTEKESDPHAGV